MSDLISVIIPVYNAEAYLEECVASVLNSTYHETELWLLDDGSTDRSGEICGRLAKAASNIRYERLDHRGVSATRNTGLELAQGKYVFFMDSDDAIHPQLLECLYENCIKRRAAMAVPSRLLVEQSVWEQRMKMDKHCQILPKCMYYKNEDLIWEFFYKNSCLHSIGGILVKKDLAKTVRFSEDIARGEDTLFVYECALQKSDCVFLKREWYYYRIHTTNTTKVLSKKSIENVYEVYKRIYDSEMKLGREVNAKHWMRKYAMSLTHYYHLAQKEKNKELQKYITGEVNANKQELCIGMTSKERFRYILCFQCYPLYRLVYAVFLKMRALRVLIRR